ncbi:MAG TPA: potassium-transporting ATPase subunit KdpA [Rudaea sp.]|nr:potassium-transporting ATPase subunit KdpA [Rudaea sp.]
MNANAYIQLGLYMAVLLLLVKPLGSFMAAVFSDSPNRVTRIGGPAERVLYRISGVAPDEEMTWTRYAWAMLIFNVAGLLVVYALMRLQAWLPLNPQKMDNVPADLSLNTAISFATNTNWQAYSGESTLSYFTQMLGLCVQNFLSAATGVAVLIAVIRGFTRRSSKTIGNFWVDLTRSTLYIFLPLAFVLSLLLVWQGVPQNFSEDKSVPLVEQTTATETVKDADGNVQKDAEGKDVTKSTPVTEQSLPLGPAASQIAIKQLGTNGGGYYGVNSAYPYENPTPLTDFLEVLSILLISAALCYTFGKMVGDRRQGWALLAAMLVIFVPLLLFCTWAEQAGNPAFARLGIDQGASVLQAGGNMEGKETRFGIVDSARWATATTAASNGSVDAMHDSFTPLGGLVPMWLIELGEVIFGGVGSGLYGMIAFAVVAVFIAGLMVGRTPEYLGKKIEAYEMKMASLVVLIPCALVVIGTAIVVSAPQGLALLTTNSGVHGFSEVLYNLSSVSNNNGSAFGGMNPNTPFFNTLTGICMFFARFPLAIGMLAIAGSLAAKKHVPPSAGTLPTHTPLFVVLLAITVVIVGALTFLPALALGPIAEHLAMLGR